MIYIFCWLEIVFKIEAANNAAMTKTIMHLNDASSSLRFWILISNLCLLSVV